MRKRIPPPRSGAGTNRRAPRTPRFDLPYPMAVVQRRGSARGASSFRITGWNRQAEHLSGIRAQDIIGKEIREVFRGAGRAAVLRSLQVLSRTGKPFSRRALPWHIGQRVVSVGFSAWMSGSGTYLILEFPRTTADPARSLEAAQHVLDSVTDSYFAVDRSWHVRYLSPKAERLLRLLGARSGSSETTDLLTPLSAALSAANLERLRHAMAHREPVSFEDCYHPLNIWFEITAVPFLTGLSISFRDVTRRKLAEAAFLKLSNAVEQTADAVFITNKAGYIEYVNPAFERITGYRRNEALGKTPSFLQADPGAEDVHRSLWSGTRQPEIFHTTSLQRRKSGEPYYAEETITPVRDTDGNISHFTTTLRDITERIRTDEALRQSEERFRALVENSSDGIALLQPDGSIVYAGPSTQRIMGYSTSGFLQQNFYPLIHPDDRAYTETALRSIASQPPQVHTMRFRLRHKDGTWRWIEATVNNQAGDAPVSGIIVNYRNVTDRKIMEDALQRSEVEYRNLFERANDAIFIFEPHTEIILEANTRACELYRFSKDELTGMSLKRITKDVSRGEEEIKLLMREKSSRNFETTHFTKDGKPLEMIVNSSVVEYNGREAVMSIVRDLSELRRLENQLRQAQKMESIGTLAGGVAHDFNNILSIILGYTSLLKRGRIDPEKVPESLNAITKAAQRGANLVRQILTFARKTEVLFESINVNDVLQDLIKLLSETFPKTVTFRLQLDERIPAIVADSNQLHQVFMNLCVNARDAMGERGVLTIRTELVPGSGIPDVFEEPREQEYVRISVSDTGVGMDEATKNRIFEPFFTTKRQGQGTGLGLSVVYGIVKTHRGFIDVQSRKGEGTTFFLYFPVQMRSFEPAGARIDSVEEVPGGRETILLIEDEEMLLNLVKELLESKGYEVLAAADGLQAMDLYARHHQRIQLVLTDIGLPKVSGWEVCRKINELNPAARVVVASGYLDPSVKSEMQNSSARDFIHKPYLPEDVLTRIRKVLDSP